MCSAMSGGWNPTINLTTHLGRQAGLGSRPVVLSLPDDCRPAWPWPGQPPASSRYAPCLATGGGGRAPRRHKPAAILLRPHRPCARRVEGRAIAASPLWQVKNSRGKAFVDFQNDVTVSDVKLADPRRLPHPRAPQALHHARHGDRPGQDVECEWRRRARRAHRALCRRRRHDHVPPALHARRHRRSRRPSSRPGLPAGAARPRRMPWPRSRARSSSRPAPGCARTIFREPARRRKRPSTAR